MRDYKEFGALLQPRARCVGHERAEGNLGELGNAPLGLGIFQTLSCNLSFGLGWVI